MTSRGERLAHLLHESRTALLDRAVESLERSALPHYASSAGPENRERLAALYDAAVDAIGRRDLGPMLRHARSVARERHKSGFGLLEVHTAFNVLEEVVWRAVTEQMAPEDYPEAFGLVSTVLGAGKQTLAIEWVALTDPRARFETLDLTELFKGTA